MERLDDPQPAARRRALRVGLAAALAALLAAAAAGVLAWSLLDEEERTPELVLNLDESDRLFDPLVADPTGTRLPDTRFDVLHADTATFADYEGRPLVVNWFSSTCAPCLREMPAFEQVHQEVKGEVTFLGISVQDGEKATRELVERTGVTYDIGRDPTGEIFSTIGGLAMPSTWFVDSAGRISDVHAGEMSARALRRAIDKLSAAG